MNKPALSCSLLALILLLMAARGVAADFRVLDFDAACDEVPALEAAGGTTPVTGRLPSGFQFAFHARQWDRDAIAGYACRDGRLFRGAYIFPVKDEAEATALYTQIKQRMTRELGAPSYDFASRDYRQKMQALGATLSLADTQVAFWDGKKSEAHASVSVPSGDQGWRVSLSYTALDAVTD